MSDTKTLQRVQTLAKKYRSAGDDNKTALKKAWKQVKG